MNCFPRPVPPGAAFSQAGPALNPTIRPWRLAEVRRRLMILRLSAVAAPFTLDRTASSPETLRERIPPESHWPRGILGSPDRTWVPTCITCRSCNSTPPC